MIKEPMWKAPPTFRPYEEYVKGVAFTEGWNSAMEYIFAEELEKEKCKIKSCWMVKNYGYWLCDNCQNKNNCEVRENGTNN